MARLGTARPVALVAAAALGIGILSGGPAAATPSVADSAAVTSIRSPIPKAYWCRKALDRLELYRNSSAFVPPSTLTILNQTVQVDPSNLELISTPFTDPSRVMWFRSLLWLTVAAVDAAEKGNGKLARDLANDAVAAAKSVPDPGSSTPERLKLAMAIGWDAGTTFRRSESLLCLSAVTGIGPLRNLLAEQAKVLMDPRRYPGPPFHSVHNHGMLVNLVLLDIARALDVPEYKRVAMARILNDLGSVFSPLGWAREGSTSYQSVNVDGWRNVQLILGNQGYVAEASALEARLAAATDTAAQVIGPTGAQVLIGNARPTDVVLHPGLRRARPLLHVDAEGGLAVGRWSWTDRATTWWTAQNRLRRGGHGHFDNLSLTWQATGVPVLVDPGQPDYDPKQNPMTAWSLTPWAHNRPVPVTTHRDSRKIRQLSALRDGRLDDLRLATTDQGPLQSRRVLIDSKRLTVEVVDDSERYAVQSWHFGPGWRATRLTRRAAVLAGPGGRILTVTSPEGSISSLSGSMSPIGGWQVVGFERLVPATELRIEGRRHLTTTFALRRSARVKPAPVPTIVPSTSTVGKTWVSVGWTIPGQSLRSPKKAKKRKRPAKYGRVVGYRLQMKAPGSPWRTVRVDSKRTVTRAKISRLKTRQPHHFRVASLTANSVSAYSKPRRFTPHVVKRPKKR